MQRSWLIPRPSVTGARLFRSTRVCRVIAIVTGIVTATALPCGMLALSTAAFAQQQLPKVEITGSSLKRIDAEQALPVTVITRQDIERSGATNTEQLLANVSSTSFVGSYNTAESAGAGTYGLASVSLRGLGSQRTLVLVNGRRLANFAGEGTSIDVNAIPLSAVDRVEILRDGASSIYGSDAVGGVINFILRKNFNGAEGWVYGGTPTRSGGGQQYKLGFVAGLGDLATDRYNAMLSFDYSKERALYGGQRAFSNYSWTADGLYTNSATTTGTLLGPWTVGLPAGQQTGLDPNVSYHPLAPNNCAQNGSGYDPLLGTCRYNPSPLVDLLPDTERYNLSANLTLQLDKGAVAFGEMFYTRARIYSLQQPSPISPGFLQSDQKFAGSGVDASLLLYPGNPNYPLAYLTSQGLPTNQPYAVTLRSIDNGRRAKVDDNGQLHLVGGVEGSLQNWDYTTALSYNESRVSESTRDGYMSQLGLVQLLNNTPDWDPYALHQSPALAAAMQATNYNGPMLLSKLSTTGIDAKINRSLGALPGGPISLAIGAGLRHESYDFQPSAAYQSGDISGYGGQQLPLNASRNTTSVFSEVELPIFTSFVADVSVRTDKYPNETSTNPKASLKWRPLSSLLLRSSYGTGFREASLTELYTPQILGSTASFVDPRFPNAPPTQYTLLAGGNPNLKPEKSRQFSVGLVFEPSSNLLIGIDYFQVKLKDTIQNGGLAPEFIAAQAAAGNPAYTPYVQRDSSGNIALISSLNINAGATSAAGFDLDAKAKLAKTAYGEVTAALNGTYMTKYDVTLPDGTLQRSVATTIDENGLPLAIQNNAGGGIVMRWRHALTLAIANDAWGASLVQNFQSGYGDNTDSYGNAHSVASFATYDVQADCTPIKNLKLTLGVKNLLDRDPPLAYTNGTYFQVGWDPTYYDPRSRFVYLGLKYKF